MWNFYYIRQQHFAAFIKFLKNSPVFMYKCNPSVNFKGELLFNNSKLFDFQFYSNLWGHIKSPLNTYVILSLYLKKIYIRIELYTVRSIYINIYIHNIFSPIKCIMHMVRKFQFFLQRISANGNVAHKLFSKIQWSCKTV